jgi:hypothetical protein
LLTDLATTIQSNLNAMAIAATRNYATPATGLISDKFCPVGGSLHNKTLLSWVSNIVRVFESADALTAFTLSPNYAGGTIFFLPFSIYIIFYVSLSETNIMTFVLCDRSGPANLPLTDPTTPGDDTPLGAAIILDAPDAQRLIWSYDLRVNQSRVASTVRVFCFVRLIF